MRVRSKHWVRWLWKKSNSWFIERLQSTLWSHGISSTPQLRYLRRGTCGTWGCVSKHWVDLIEIAINFVNKWKLGDHTHVNLDDTFCFHTPQHLDNDRGVTTVKEAHSQSDRHMWEEAMRSKLKSLRSKKVFSPVKTTSKGIKPVGCNL